MGQVGKIEVRWTTAEILTATDGTYDQGHLTIQHPTWILKDTVAKEWIARPGNCPDLTVKGQYVYAQAAAGAPPVPPRPFEKKMKLVKFTGRNTECVFKDA